MKPYCTIECFVDPTGVLIQVISFSYYNTIDIIRCDGVEQLDDNLFDFFEDYTM